MASGEMQKVLPATIGDLDKLEEKITKRQDNYELKCDTDRASLRGEVESVKTVIERVEKKTDEGNTMIQPIADMFKPLFANPKVQTALIGVILAGLGLLAYKLNGMTNPPQQPQTVIIYPQPQQITADAGTK